MAKSVVDKKAAVKETPVTDKADFAFGKENYRLFIAAIAVIIVGYALMSGGKTTDPKIFNEEIFSFRRITLAPIVVLAGYVLGVYAIVKKAD